jgi:hypothetical protein
LRIMFHKCLTYLMVIVSFSSGIYAQKEADNWFLLNDNLINFSLGYPVLVTPPPGECGSWNSSTCNFFYTFLCGSSISDPEGNLLMYSNGEVIWNAAFDTMPYGQYLAGDYMSSQCVIIPRPGFPKRYYIFVTDWLNTSIGVRYSEIDLEQDVGLGAVMIPYNHLLHSPTCQKVTAVYHANGVDIWVLVHEYNSSTFVATLVTKNGVSTNKIFSSVGTIHQEPIPSNPYVGDHASAGEMKFSTCGNKVALAIRGLDKFEVFDFNNETGVVSNPISLTVLNAESVEFSPDGTLAYIGNSRDYNYDLDTARIYQINLMAGDSGSVVNSFILITGPNNKDSEHHMQLATDGKIYDALSYYYDPYNDYISFIQFPNTPGTGCNYSANSFLIPSGYCGSGPPQSMPNFFRSPLDRNILFENQCLGDTTFIYTLTNTDFDSIRWVFEDSLTGILFSIPNQDSVYHAFSGPGSYEIYLKRYRNGNLSEIKKRLYIYPVVNQFFDDTSICEGAQLALQVSDTFCQFAWVNDFSSDTLFSGSVSISQEGKWWPIVTNYNKTCGYIDTVHVGVHYNPICLGNDTVACSTNLLQLGDTISYVGSYSWSTGDTTPLITAGISGLYSLTATQFNCIFSDSISIQYDDPIQLSLTDSILFCDELNYILEAGDFPADFLWSPNGETTAGIIVEDPGLYSVMASNACGVVSDSTEVILYYPPQLYLGSDSVFCFGDTLHIHNLLTGQWGPEQHQWSTGSTAESIVISDAGTYSLLLNTFCGSVSDSIILGVDYTPIVDFGTDTVICDGTPLTLATNSLGTYLWSPNGETTQSITVLDQDNYSLSVTNACGTVSGDILVVLDFYLNIDLGNDTSFCLNDSILLLNYAQLPNNPYTYCWSNGKTTSSIMVSTPGAYFLSVTNACGIFHDSILVYRDTLINVELGNDTLICLGDYVQLGNQQFSAAVYQWSNGETSYYISAIDSGYYSLTVTNACGMFSDTLLLLVHENTFSFPFDTLWLPLGQTISIDAGTGYYSYNWSNGSTTQSITVGYAGIFCVDVNDSVGCLGSDTVEVIIIDEIHVFNAFNNIIIYPNPVKDELIISGLNINTPDDYYISLYNYLGQEIELGKAQCITQPGGNAGFLRIDFSGFNSGINLLSISHNNYRMIVKVVKE